MVHESMASIPRLKSVFIPYPTCPKAELGAYSAYSAYSCSRRVPGAAMGMVQTMLWVNHWGYVWGPTKCCRLVILGTLFSFDPVWRGNFEPCPCAPLSIHGMCGHPSHAENSYQYCPSVSGREALQKSRCYSKSI